EGRHAVGHEDPCGQDLGLTPHSSHQVLVVGDVSEGLFHDECATNGHVRMLARASLCGRSPKVEIRLSGPQDGARQYAPRFEKTAGMVRSMISRSSPNDQLRT